MKEFFKMVGGISWGLLIILFWMFVAAVAVVFIEGGCQAVCGG